MREKPLNKDALNRTMAFINHLNSAAAKQEEINLTKLARQCSVGTGTGRACIDLGIVEKVGKKYKWLKGDSNYYELALLIKDRLLHITKKKIHVPINPDWATPIINHIKEISDKISLGIVQQDKLLKLGKNTQGETTPDIFRIDDQRVYLAGQMIRSIYQNIIEIDDEMGDPKVENNIRDCNELIIWATDDLLKQLRSNGINTEIIKRTV